MKQGETLEQMARAMWSEWVNEQGALSSLSSKIDCSSAFAAAFARKVLEEARLYMQHSNDCNITTKRRTKDSAGNWRDEPCSCGLAELLEGWK